MLDHARQYVELLAYGRAVTWQTFDDSKRKRHDLARIFHGTLRELLPELTRLNRAGAGVFVCVNETDLRGRCSSNVVALRALFTDDDGDGLRRFPLAPCFVVHSARGPQAYWLLRNGEPLDRFGPGQRQLAAAMRTDGKVHDLPRVMRAPGFWHIKGEPFMVTLELGHIAKRYSIDEVLAAYPAEVKLATTPTRAIVRREPTSCPAVERARRYLAKAGPAVEGSGGDHKTYRLAATLVHGFELDQASAVTLLDEWNASCSPPWAVEELERKVVNAVKYGIKTLKL